MSQTQRRFVVARVPTGALTADCFRLEDAPVPEPKEGEVLLRSLYVSLDAANRAWMQGATYRAAVEPGSVMAGGALGEVVASRHPQFKPGELASGDLGWQEYSAVPGKALLKETRVEPLSHLQSVYGITGLTAYFGLLEVGQPKAGETLVVSAAAGAVGNVVGQIGKILGCRVVGVAGGDAKCHWLTETLGFDAAVDYKAGPMYKSLKAACPQGIDVYFDNVGGDVFEAALFQMNARGRIACCGAVSGYDSAPPPHGPRGVPGMIVVKRLTVRGFIVMDFFARRAAALAQLQAWVRDGKIRVVEDVIDGFENLPQALVGLLHGENRGKRMVKVRGQVLH
ncbi:MAG: NADP-dependent oxidoreductase [Betaproteobacteria bacterium RIFCSPLOWO2_02_FULL_68_150]|nr:MAG: NADP-dependent oxidoreductase [Betaproteobacteria bacterium RIFCSPLOWO2_02_FULL_68_150]